MNDARAAGAPDFVDRLVVKAFGGAEMAAPRVPSAYEPLRPHAGLAPGAAQTERIDEDAMFGDDAIDGDPHKSRDRRRPTSARTLDADGSSALAANAVEESERAAAERSRPRRRAHRRGNAADGRDAGSSSARVIDDGDAAGALVPAQAASDPHSSRPGDRPESDAATPIARSAVDGAASHSTRSGQASTALATEDAALVVQPAARLRASLDMGPFTRESGGEDGADADSRSQRAASETFAGEGLLMPVAHDGAPHGMNDRAGWREPASRRASDEASAETHDVTINVTIGRVDVRAVQAAAPAARPARARGAQPLALDEYLARHGGAR